MKDISPRLIVGDRGLLASIESDVPRLLFSEVHAQLPATPMFEVSDAVNGELPFQIIFTSGTTAEPKGIVLTHRNVLASLQPIEAEIAKYLKYERWVHPLRFLHTLPLSHVFGQFMGMWVPPLITAEVHFDEQLEPSRMTELIHRERISVLVTVPRVLHLLRSHLLARYDSLARDLERAKDLSAWKRWWRFRQVHHALGWKFWAVISGGATLPADLEDFWNMLGFALIQGYGMTETTALVTLNHPFRIEHGTIGKALPGREIRISDDGRNLGARRHAGSSDVAGRHDCRQQPGRVAGNRRSGGKGCSPANCDYSRQKRGRDRYWRGNECAPCRPGRSDDEAAWSTRMCRGAVRDHGRPRAGCGRALLGER